LPPGVTVVQATDSREADDAGASVGTLLDRAPARSVLADAEVCPVPVVVGDEGADHLAEVALVQDDDVVEQFAADRGDEALSDSIGASCRVHRKGSDRRDVFG